MLRSGVASITTTRWPAPISVRTLNTGSGSPGSAVLSSTTSGSLDLACNNSLIVDVTVALPDIWRKYLGPHAQTIDEHPVVINRRYSYHKVHPPRFFRFSCPRPEGGAVKMTHKVIERYAKLPFLKSLTCEDA